MRLNRSVASPVELYVLFKLFYSQKLTLLLHQQNANRRMVWTSTYLVGYLG